LFTAHTVALDTGREMGLPKRIISQMSHYSNLDLTHPFGHDILAVEPMQKKVEFNVLRQDAFYRYTTAAR
jgi:hypothetical protein